MFSLQKEVNRLPATPKSRLTKDDIEIIGFALLIFHREQVYPKDEITIGKQIKRIMKELDPNITYLLHGRDKECSI